MTGTSAARQHVSQTFRYMPPNVAAPERTAPTLRLVDPVGAQSRRVALRYVARAGLLPELSRQTYDSFPKALREAILNSLDAGAQLVEIDLSRAESHNEIVVSDDGEGMSLADFCDHFMSLGGSRKFADSSRFGRIGIGSLALLQYADVAVIETKQSGTQTATRARIEHVWSLDRDERRSKLADVNPGFAEEFTTNGPVSEHFTRLRLEGINGQVQGVAQDPAAFYDLLDVLGRILPLKWQDTRLTKSLAHLAPDLDALLREHVGQWSANVLAHASWERNVAVQRRSYGDDPHGTEDWAGQPAPLLKTVRIPDNPGPRAVVVAGYLLNQKRADPRWSGLTARVQNVAVEQNTFFDISADPGFRKYITGEVWLLGDVDRARLINIDRSSFNRECLDYQAVQRYASRAIMDFKTSGVQRPQRQKVAVRRILEDHVRTIKAIRAMGQLATVLLDEIGEPLLPSSAPDRRTPRDRVVLADILGANDTEICSDTTLDDDDLRYTLEMTPDGSRVQVRLGDAALNPTVTVGNAEYRIRYFTGGDEAPPVVIRNRPREIALNTAHSAHAGRDGHEAYQLSFALEVSYLLNSGDAAAMYDTMIAFMEIVP